MVSALLVALWFRQTSATPLPTVAVQTDLVVGKWKALPPAGGPERFWYWTLDIREDGTFHQHRDLRIMVNILGDGSGTWHRETKGIRLKGQGDESFDDGYGQSRKTIPIDDLLIERGGRLIIHQSLPGEKPNPSTDLVFRRVATLDREPEPPAPPPDRRALAIWAQCRKTYRGDSHFRTSGSGVHPGEKNRPLSTRFALTFSKAGGLVLDVVDGGTVFHVRATSTRSSLRSDVFAEPYAGDRWAALDSLFEMTALDFGVLAELLLTPSTGDSRRYTDFRFRQESTVNGVPCDELGFVDRQGYRWIASIGKQSHRLIQLQDTTAAFRLRIGGLGWAAIPSRSSSRGVTPHRLPYRNQTGLGPPW